MYETGRVVVQDDKEAVKWYRLAAEQGFAQAQINLGWFYSEGRGVVQDDVYAYMWYILAASVGTADEVTLASTNRDHVATHMTSVQIEEAKNKARTCQANNFKQCE
ncbi:MAG: tetratricopeptide repeat protein, partial [Gammaproteobacteria bacterium]